MEDAKDEHKRLLRRAPGKEAGRQVAAGNQQRLAIQVCKASVSISLHGPQGENCAADGHCRAYSAEPHCWAMPSSPPSA